MKMRAIINATDILVEKTSENMGVLGDCVELFVQNMPYKFEIGEVHQIGGDSLRGLDALVKKYANTRYGVIIKNLENHYVVYINPSTVIRTAGSYTSRPAKIFKFNISGFLKQSRDITRDELLATRVDGPIKTFRAIILHEIRHMFQSQLFSNYYNKVDQEDIDYRANPIEIDAAWMHHLQDFDVGEFENPNAYVRAVMDGLGVYKTLTPQQQEHLRRKTAQYYMARTRGEGGDSLRSTAKERVIQRRAIFKKQVAVLLAPIMDSDYNLQKLNGYDRQARMYFLPVRAIRAVFSYIQQDKVVPPMNAPIVVLVMALVTPLDDVPEVLRHLRLVQRITPTEALANVDTTFGGGWDIDAIKRQITQVFG